MKGRFSHMLPYNSSTMIIIILALLCIGSNGASANTNAASLQCNLALQNISADPYTLFQSNHSIALMIKRIINLSYLSYHSTDSDSGLRQISWGLGVDLPSSPSLYIIIGKCIYDIYSYVDTCEMTATAHYCFAQIQVNQEEAKSLVKYDYQMNINILSPPN